jgi:DNA-3-methyladenine glycosylase I
MDKKRCRWVPEGDELYVRYHDEEWGRPEHDDGRLYEMFLLEMFQAGLSWRLLLHKRENFRKAYDGFDVDKVAAYGEADVERLMADAGIVRNRAKIEASISNSRIFKEIQKEFGSFDSYIWHFTGGKTIREDLSVTRDGLSDEVSSDLKKRGCRFAGTTSIFSFLQSVGIINSHDPDCFVYWELTR